MDINTVEKYSIEIVTLADSNSDSFLLKFHREPKNRYILIDGGLRKHGRKSLEIISDIFKRDEMIDLVILTHVDLDHINGILSIFESEFVTSNNIGGVLFNIPHTEIELAAIKEKKTQCGYKEGNKLLELILNKNITIFKAIQGKKFNIDNEILIKILAPTQSALDSDHYNWRSTNIGHDENECYDKDILLKEKHTEDSKPQNVSSIACLVSYNNKRMLFSGDSVPSQILSSEEESAPVDFFKVPHHGSKYNISPELLVEFPSQLYLIPGNRSSYPNFYTIALLDEGAPKSQVYVPKGSWVHSDKYKTKINLNFIEYESGTRIFL